MIPLERFFLVNLDNFYLDVDYQRLVSRYDYFQENIL